MTAGDEPRMRVHIYYTSSALTGCYRAWFEGRLKMKPAEFVQYMIEISMRANDFTNLSSRS